jgi:ligand-binding sensor domain-containing protein
MRMDFAKFLVRFAAAWCCGVVWLGSHLAAAPGHVLASPLYTVDSWENDDGLPQSSIISMTQTRDGYLWLGTINGLVRFDGRRFPVFNEDNTPGLGSSPIVGLFEDRRGNLWIGSELSGVLLAKDGQVTSLGIGHGSKESRLRSICEDVEGAVWLTLWDGQLWRWKDGVTNRFSAGLEKTRGYHSVIADAEGRLWVGTETSTFAVNPKSDLARGELLPGTSRASASLDFLLASRAGGYWRFGDGRIERWETNGAGRVVASYAWRAGVTAACEDHDGNLLVGTLGEGVFRLDAAGKAEAVTPNQVLFVLSLVVDRENTLWVGTDGNGLQRLKPRLFQVVEPSRGLTVRSVTEDALGGVWMGFNAVDFSIASAGYWKDDEFRGYGRAEGLMNSSVFSVLADRRGQVWAGTGGGLFTLRGGRGFANALGAEALQTSVFAIHEDREGRMLFGTAAGLVRWSGGNVETFSKREGMSADAVTAIAEDRQGNLWVGTRTAGLNQLRDGKFIAFRKTDGLPSDEISSLFVDVEDVLWVVALLDEGWTGEQ